MIYFVNESFQLNSWILEEFQIKYFAERLKKIAKSDFGGVGKLADAIKLANLSAYTKLKDTREPKASMLFRFAKVGIDINKLLTGEGYVDKGIEARFKEMEEKFEARIINLEAELYRKDKKIEKLTSDNGVLLSRVSALNETVSKNKFMNKL